jgi:hypothetical protein
MIFAKLTGWVITHEGDSVQVGESGKLYRMIEAIKYYAESCKHTDLRIQTEDEG